MSSIPLRSSSISSSNSLTETATTPVQVPPLVYRIQLPTSQTRYSFSSGFRSKNQTTILNYTSLLQDFGNAHLSRATNISSPFISVYDSLSHAEAVAAYFSHELRVAVTLVTIDTAHLARGPVFRAADLLRDRVLDEHEAWIHHGEYLVQYRIPPQAVRQETVVGEGRGSGSGNTEKDEGSRWGVIGAR
ncbi:hypothetical protein P154DRAFT_611869 [Amniculicola lignicola CBS 123094]|uniref:DUF7587 domain-containing protein n=1 Tax=Amniculicola lignicola CBS 123094 TaxID=1392246 RepID=A0A6A5WWE7_9PLEO|nr:hypothetical protein P154DRAFT_611869 [Amniculicola lignicola CBS 123094]